jgi:hypothetical protein
LPIFIRTLTPGILAKILNFYPHRPVAFSDFSAIFIRTWLRDLVGISGVLQSLVLGLSNERGGPSRALGVAEILTGLSDPDL